MPPAPRRGTRPSSLPLGADDIYDLTLPEIRARLERNERVLQSSFFTHTPSQSPIRTTIASSSSASTITSLTTSPDPVRDKLSASRDLLLQREQELILADNINKLEMKLGPGEDTNYLSESRGGRKGGKSGKAVALALIQAKERETVRNGITRL